MKSPVFIQQINYSIQSLRLTSDLLWVKKMIYIFKEKLKFNGEIYSTIELFLIRFNII